MRLTPSTLIVVTFVWHVMVAVLGFLTIFGAAITLNLFTEFVRHGDLLPGEIVWCMKGLEYALVGIDVTGFGYFILIEFVNLLSAIHALRHRPIPVPAGDH